MVNDYRLITNGGDGGHGHYQPTGGLTAHVSWLSVMASSHFGAVLYSLSDPGELSQQLRHDDSTINVKHCPPGTMPTPGLVSSGGPTATLESDVSRLPARSCGTAFQLVLGKQTSAMNSLSSR